MRYSNLHTHTVFSDGIHTVEENVRAAQSQQLLCLGFSDHSYTPCDRSYCMLPENYSAYRHAVEKAKKNSPLPIYLGLELDAFSRENPGEYDYVIASVHYLNAGGAVYAIDHTPDAACLPPGRLPRKCVGYAALLLRHPGGACGKNQPDIYRPL